MLTFAEINQKGGSGKSPGAVNIGHSFARKNLKVLMVDADPQATFTEHLLGSRYPIGNPSFYHALKDLKRIKPIVITPRMDLLPANMDLQYGEIELQRKANFQMRTAKLLELYANDYAICVIDTPGSVSMYTVLALAAADQVIIPVKTELNHVRALVDTMETIKDVQESGLNARLKIWGILPTQHEVNTLHHQEALQILKHTYGELVYSEISNKTTKYNDAVTLKGDVGILDAELARFWDRITDGLLENEQRREV
jgi:chromosome partitioning protein